MLEQIAGIGLGCIIGLCTGLIPGLHSNLITVTILAIMGRFTGTTSDFWTNCLIAIPTVHLFVNMLPSMLLGTTEDNKGSFPLQRLVKQGRAEEGIRAGIAGTLIGIGAASLLTPILVTITKPLYDSIKAWIPWILIGLLGLTIYKEKEKIKAVGILIISGAVGYYTFHQGLDDPLLPLLGGLFGISSLILTLSEKQRIVKQRESSERKESIIPTCMKGIIMAAATSILPTVSASYAAFLVSLTTKVRREIEWIVLSSSINATYLITSLTVFLAIGKQRSGVIAGIASIEQIPKIGINGLLIAILIASGIGAWWTWYSGQKLMRQYAKLPIQKIKIGVILFIIALTTVLTGYKGVLILTIAATVGILTSSWRVGRSLEMGALMIPVIIFFVFSV